MAKPRQAAWCLVAVGVLTLGFLAVRLRPDRQIEPATSTLYSELVVAIGAVRPCEARLAGVGYAPYRGKKGSGRDNRALRTFVLHVEHAAEHHVPAALASVGLLRLVKSDFPGAADALRHAQRHEPTNPAWLTNLAASYSCDTMNPIAPLLALETADLAVRTDADLPEARFNLALALERLSLFNDARQAWTSYLELDRHSPFRAEARRHLALLTNTSASVRAGERQAALIEAARKRDAGRLQSIVRVFQPQAQERGEELLGRWASALAERNLNAASEALAEARAIGAVLESVCRDHMIEDAVAVVDRNAGATPAALAALSGAHAAYYEVWLLHKRRGEMSPTTLERARSGLRRIGSPLANRVELFAAVNAYRSGRYRQALRSLARMRALPHLDRYPSLDGARAWLEGLVLVAQGDPKASLPAYDKALFIFTSMGAQESIASVRTRLAEAHLRLGDDAGAWTELREALRLASQVGDPERMQPILDQAADASSKRGHLISAAYFRRESVGVAESARDPLEICYTLLRLYEALHHLGRVHEESLALAQLEGQRPKLASTVDRATVLADSALTRGEAAAETDPAAATRLLGQALDFYRQEHKPLLLAKMYLLRARAQLRSGQLVYAQADLDAGIAECEKAGAYIDTPELQASYFQRWQDLFDGMVELQGGHLHHGDLALEYSERKHARPLLAGKAKGMSLSSARAGDELSVKQICARLPQRVTLIEYAVLRESLYIWVLRREGVTFIITETTRQALDRAVALLQGGAAGTRTLEAAAAVLYDMLIRPAAALLKPGELLVFVTDKSLNSVPFALLRDGRTGRYLVQDYPLSNAPSASFFLLAAERARTLGHPALDILFVGNPDSVLLPGDPSARNGRELPRLPGVTEEASALAKVYAGTAFHLVAGRAATKARFLAEAGRHTVVHLAGHAVLNPDYPFLSYLALAPTTADPSGFLYVRELYRFHLQRTRLVVLSACSSSGTSPGGEQLASLAGGFLAAGVPSVVASLWEVDDHTAAALFTVFHRRLRESGNPAQALREAQLAMLASGDENLRSPAGWGAFTVLGFSTDIQAEEEERS
jgi:CHAT domain-containing protein/tetratricopeptide (TPR) repeat protein